MTPLTHLRPTLLGSIDYKPIHARTPYDPHDQGDQGDDSGEYYDYEAAQLAQMHANELTYQERIYQAADRCAADEERLSHPALPEGGTT